jgi:hypothetical protein
MLKRPPLLPSVLTVCLIPRTVVLFDVLYHRLDSERVRLLNCLREVSFFHILSSDAILSVRDLPSPRGT